MYSMPRGDSVQSDNNLLPVMNLSTAPAFPETHNKAISKNFFTGHPLAHTYGKSICLSGHAENSASYFSF